MCFGVAEDEVGRAGADAVALRARARRVDQFGVRREPEIIVAAESDVIATVARAEAIAGCDVRAADLRLRAQRALPPMLRERSSDFGTRQKRLPQMGADGRR
jgi:hypothetical protein